MAFHVRKRLLRLFFPALAVASAAAAAGPIGPVGSEFRVNTYTIATEWRPAVAASASGFVVVWHGSDDHDGDATGVFAQRFTSGGTRLGVEFQVNRFTTGFQYYADVAMDADGDFIVVWQSFGQDDGSNGVFAQRFMSNGAPLGVEFQVNTTTSLDEREASVAMDAGGNFVVAWTSFLGDASSDAVLAQRFDSDGAKVGAEFMVNSRTFSTQKKSRVAMSEGSFVVVWQSFAQDDFTDYGVFGRRFASNGAALGAEFLVNLRTLLTQWEPDVAMGDDGDFVVVWDSFQEYGDVREVVARRYDSNGAAQGGELLVNTRTINDQRYTTVAKDATGSFVVAWSTYIDNVSDEDIFARFFDSAGVAFGVEFRVSEFEINASTIARQSRPVVAMAGEGRFVVAWESNVGDDSAYDVLARRLLPFAKLDFDNDGEVAPLTDGLIGLRFLFGFDGAALTAGALGPHCTRCAAAEIETYATGLGLVLDVDGNDSLDAPTDGLLLLGYLFEFSGPALIADVVGDGCSRCEPGDIVDYLEPLRSRE